MVLTFESIGFLNPYIPTGFIGNWVFYLFNYSTDINELIKGSVLPKNL